MPLWNSYGVKKKKNIILAKWVTVKNSSLKNLFAVCWPSLSAAEFQFKTVGTTREPVGILLVLCQ